MPETLSKESFAEQLNTKFRVLLETENAPEVELELAELVEFPALTHGRTDVERFSLFFYGPGGFFLPQATYRVAHERLGEQDIPRHRAGAAATLRAVFIYYKRRVNRDP